MEELSLEKKSRSYGEHVSTSLNEKLCRMQEKILKSHIRKNSPFFVNHFGKMREQTDCVCV